MKRSKKKTIWNRRKGDTGHEDYKDLEYDERFDEEAREKEMIASVQQRLGVSRERARTIIKNSELI